MNLPRAMAALFVAIRGALSVFSVILIVVIVASTVAAAAAPASSSSAARTDVLQIGFWFGIWLVWWTWELEVASNNVHT